MIESPLNSLPQLRHCFHSAWHTKGSTVNTPIRIFFICIHLLIKNCWIGKETQRTNGSSMNSVEQRIRSENKKAEHSRVALHPRSDQEPPSTMQIGAPGKIMQKKAQSHWTQFTCSAWQKTFFTWSVSDVFAVRCEQFSISRCHY